MNNSVNIIALSFLMLSQTTFSANDINTKTGEFSLVFEFYEPEKNEHNPKEYIAPMINCDVKFSPMIDERKNKLTVGSNYNVPLKAVDVDVWLDKFTLNLNQRTHPTSTNNSNEINISPKMLKLYSYAEGMNLHGVMAVKLDYYRSEVLLNTYHLRGYATKANWNNGIGEYRKVINMAMSDAADVITKKINTLCEE
jgi:hypothetical protein